MLFWVVTPCSSEKALGFWRTHRLHLQRKSQATNKQEAGGKQRFALKLLRSENLKKSSAYHLLFSYFLLDLLFDTEHGSDMFLRNVGLCRRPWPSCSQMVHHRLPRLSGGPRVSSVILTASLAWDVEVGRYLQQAIVPPAHVYSLCSVRSCTATVRTDCVDLVSRICRNVKQPAGAQFLIARATAVSRVLSGVWSNLLVGLISPLVYLKKRNVFRVIV
jgi:hypothetical protein